MLQAAENVDKDAIKLIARFMAPLRWYFRYEARGLENVPPSASLVVANHSGGKLPIDMFLFADAWYKHFGVDTPLRVLIHDILYNATPWIAKSFRRIGALPASRDAAARMFGKSEHVLVLPGGDYETYRPFWQRYQVDFGARSGFVELALKQRVPITPVVTIGSHNIFFILTRGQSVARWLRLHKIFRYNAFPIIVGFPFGLYFGPLPSPWPLPAKIVTQVLPPVRLYEAEADHPAYTPEDLPHKRHEMQQVVVRRMQAAMDLLREKRR